MSVKHSGRAGIPFGAGAREAGGGAGFGGLRPHAGDTWTRSPYRRRTQVRRNLRNSRRRRALCRRQRVNEARSLALAWGGRLVRPPMSPSDEEAKKFLRDQIHHFFQLFLDDVWHLRPLRGI